MLSIKQTWHTVFGTVQTKQLHNRALNIYSSCLRFSY